MDWELGKWFRGATKRKRSLQETCKISPKPLGTDITPDQLFAMACEQKRYEAALRDINKKKVCDDGGVDTASTTAGGFARTLTVTSAAGTTGTKESSTVVYGSDGIDCSGDTIADLGSEWDSTISRSSKSRSSAHRGAGRKRNKREATAKKFAQKFGSDFRWKTAADDTSNPDQTRELEASQMLFPVDKVVPGVECKRGSNDIKVSGSIVHSMSSREVVRTITYVASVKEKRDLAMERLRQGPSELGCKTEAWQVEAIQKVNFHSVTNKRSGWPFCEMCQKNVNDFDQHCNSKGHNVAPAAGQVIS